MKPYTLEELQALAESYTWKDFEDTETGDRIVRNWLNWRRCTLHMRIGLHLGRPTQAIMGLGQYLRFRAAPEWAEYRLEILDPSNPSQCNYLSPINTPRSKTWKPYWPKGGVIAGGNAGGNGGSSHIHATYGSMGNWVGGGGGAGCTSSVGTGGHGSNTTYVGNVGGGGGPTP